MESSRADLAMASCLREVEIRKLLQEELAAREALKVLEAGDAREKALLSISREREFLCLLEDERRLREAIDKDHMEVNSGLCLAPCRPSLFA